MALASSQRRESIDARASLLHSAGANCAPAQLSSLRVAHVTVAGNADPSGDLFTDLYAQLRQIAQSALRRSGPQLTVSPTTLLHEAYLKISARDAVSFPNRAHFMEAVWDRLESVQRVLRPEQRALSARAQLSAN